MRDFKSLAHTRWDCKYHAVFIPKRRRKWIYGKLRKVLGEVFHELAKRKGCRIEEGHLMADHVHMCISIPPKYSVSSVVGYLKGKSAIAIARRFKGKQRNFAGEHFWARATRKNVGRLGQVTETTKNKWTEIKLAKLHSGLDV